jgi:putative glutathione S-transferase
VWKNEWYDTKSNDGHFIRDATAFRDWVRAEPGVGLPAAKGRYHLYAAWGCPWAHRTLLVRKLKKLEDVISVSVVEPLMLENGWSFSDDKPDHLHGARFLHELYTRAKADYSGRVTVPVLWDRERDTIVSNESAEILRMFNSELDAFTDVELDLYPVPLREEIDALNQWVYDCVNNGVYKAGFATKQAAYEKAVTALFDALDRLEVRLEGHDYLVGDRLTEADVRLFTTLLRFDLVYHYHFKCNRKRIRDYPNLWAHTRRIYALPGVTDTMNLAEVKQHYFGSHRSINPTGIIPLGPDISFTD